MKRRTFRQLRAKGEPGQHHIVYVVLLDPAVGKLRKVRAENPQRDPKQACIYVAKRHYVREVSKEWLERFWALKPTR